MTAPHLGEARAKQMDVGLVEHHAGPIDFWGSLHVTYATESCFIIIDTAAGCLLLLQTTG